MKERNKERRKKLINKYERLNISMKIIYERLTSQHRSSSFQSETLYKGPHLINFPILPSDKMLSFHMERVFTVQQYSTSIFEHFIYTSTSTVKYLSIYMTSLIISDSSSVLQILMKTYYLHWLDLEILSKYSAA